MSCFSAQRCGSCIHSVHYQMGASPGKIIKMLHHSQPCRLKQTQGFKPKLNPSTPDLSSTGILVLLEAGKNCSNAQGGFLFIEEMRGMLVQPLWVNMLFIFFRIVVTVNSDSFHLTVALEVLSTDVNTRAGVGWRSVLSWLPEPLFGTKYQEKKGFFPKRSGKGRHVLGDKER